MKKTSLIVSLLCLTSVFAFSQSQTIKLDNFDFFLTPKLLKDKVITEMGFGLNYTDTLSGRVRFRYRNCEKRGNYRYRRFTQCHE